MDKGGSRIMATNTMKILLILVLMNIMVTMAFNFSVDPDSVTLGELNLQTQRFDNLGSSLNSSKDSVAPGLLSVIQVAGDAVKMGLGVMEIFVDGIRPFPADKVATDNDLDNLIWVIINFLRGMLYVVAFIVIYDKLFNKKQD